MSLAGSAVDLRLKSVLLATDLSPASVEPLHHALAIARYCRAKLYVAHVVSPVPYLMAGPEGLQLGCESASRDLQQLQRDLLQKSSLKGLDHEFVIRCGCISDELQELISKHKSIWSWSEHTVGGALKKCSWDLSPSKSFVTLSALF